MGIDIQLIPALPQRQDALASQLADLRAVANRLGLYDAADWIAQGVDSRKLVVAYGCHCDLEPGMQPDGCVIDDGTPSMCIYAGRIKRKEQCEYWRPITT